MKVIVITDERPIVDELDTVLALLGAGASIHVRKPGWSDKALCQYLDVIPKACRNRISIHGNGRLAAAYELGGLHLKSNQALNGYGGWGGKLSKSFHDVEALVNSTLSLDYAFLSPVYDSISKKGYAARLDRAVLHRSLQSMTRKMQVYALGGITPERIIEVSQLGFDGVAVLGTIWEQPTVADRVKQYERLRAYEH